MFRIGTIRADLCVFRFFYLPGLARNCVLSFFVPVVGIKAKGTRNCVLSFFVPVVGIKAKTMMELGELKRGPKNRHNCPPVACDKLLNHSD